MYFPKKNPENFVFLGYATACNPLIGLVIRAFIFYLM